MSWEKYLRNSSDSDIDDWETALKEFIKEGRKLGIPLDVITKLDGALTTAEAGPAEINITYGEEDEDSTEE